jgi:predicted RNA-binding protein with PUA-like domain
MEEERMAHWLFKTEPGTWSWDDQVKAGDKGTFWNGVRNHLAKQQMMAMRVGEQGFFYHSVNEKRIVGIVEVIKPYYPDPTDAKGMFGMVDIKAVAAFGKPVTLADVKNEPRLTGMVLVNNSRLSVQPVTEGEWSIICALGNPEASSSPASIRA